MDQTQLLGSIVMGLIFAPLVVLFFMIYLEQRHNLRVISLFFTVFFGQILLLIFLMFVFSAIFQQLMT